MAANRRDLAILEQLRFWRSAFGVQLEIPKPGLNSISKDLSERQLAGHCQRAGVH
jgi:hypothetical protein